MTFTDSRWQRSAASRDIISPSAFPVRPNLTASPLVSRSQRVNDRRNHQTSARGRLLMTTTITASTHNKVGHTLTDTAHSRWPLKLQVNIQTGVRVPRAVSWASRINHSFIINHRWLLMMKLWNQPEHEAQTQFKKEGWSLNILNLDTCRSVMLVFLLSVETPAGHVSAPHGKHPKVFLKVATPAEALLLLSAEITLTPVLGLFDQKDVSSWQTGSFAL